MCVSGGDGEARRRMQWLKGEGGKGSNPLAQRDIEEGHLS